MTEENKKIEALKHLRKHASENLVKEVRAALPGLSFINSTLTSIASSVDEMKSLDEYQVCGIAALVNGIEESIARAITAFVDDCDAIAELEAKHG